MFAGTIVGLMLVMRLWPETPIARFLHLHLVERPVSWAAKIERQQIFYILAVSGLLLVSAEVIAIFGSAELAMVYAFDLSLYADAALATYMAALLSRLQTARNRLVGLVRQLTQRVASPKNRQRAARQRRTRSTSKLASNDDEDGFSRALLLAA